jgi:hypothetical protein
VSADTPSAPHATKVDARWRASPGNMNNLSFVRHDEFIL